MPIVRLCEVCHKPATHPIIVDFELDGGGLRNLYACATCQAQYKPFSQYNQERKTRAAHRVQETEKEMVT